MGNRQDEVKFTILKKYCIQVCFGGVRDLHCLSRSDLLVESLHNESCTCFSCFALPVTFSGFYFLKELGEANTRLYPLFIEQ